MKIESPIPQLPNSQIPGNSVPRTSRVEKEKRILIALAIMILFTFIGGATGAAVSIFGGGWLESWVESSRTIGPRITYGQMFGMVIVPMCVLIGAATGFAIAVGWLRYSLTAVFLLSTTAFLGWGYTTSMWSSQIKTYGTDPSEYVLFYPPMAMSILAAGVAVLAVLDILARTLALWSRPNAEPTEETKGNQAVGNQFWKR